MPCASSSRPNPEARRGRCGRARAALRRAEALRRSARGVPAPVGQRSQRARVRSSASPCISVQMKDWATAEALFGELKRASYGDNGAVELYLAQIAEETRPLRRGDRALQGGARGRARLAREAARRRDDGQAGQASPRRGASSPTCPRSRSSSACRCGRRKRSSCATRTTTTAALRRARAGAEGASGFARPALRPRDGRREARPHRRRRGAAAPRSSSSSPTMRRR